VARLSLPHCGRPALGTLPPLLCSKVLATLACRFSSIGLARGVSAQDCFWQMLWRDLSCFNDRCPALVGSQSNGSSISSRRIMLEVRKCRHNAVLGEDQPHVIQLCQTRPTGSFWWCKSHTRGRDRCRARPASQLYLFVRTRVMRQHSFGLRRCHNKNEVRSMVPNVATRFFFFF
jgi:hypothetical protein